MNLAGTVVASAFTETTNHCWVSGLQPDMEYSYRVIVNEEEWASGNRRNWERIGDKMGLGLKSRPYLNRFRTHPDPTKPSAAPFTFAVIGDFGVGIKNDKDRGQRQIAQALEKAVDEFDVRLILTTGDDREQLIDNFYVNERIAGEEAAGRASIDPGLFNRFRCSSDVEFICIDTSKEPAVFNKRFFDHSKRQEFLDSALPAATVGQHLERRLRLRVTIRFINVT